MRCATLNILHCQWFGLLLSQFMIDWIFGGLGDLEKFCGRLGPETGQKHPKSVFSRSLGLFWTKHPPTKFVCMLNADPVNPVKLGSHVSLGPKLWPFFGGLGAISSVGDRFFRLGTKPKKKSYPKKSLNFSPPLRFQGAYFRRKRSDFGPWCPL